MILELNRIDIDCIIGDRPDERERMQRLTVDVRLELGDAVAATLDALAREGYLDSAEDDYVLAGVSADSQCGGREVLQRGRTSGR